MNSKSLSLFICLFLGVAQLAMTQEKAPIASFCENLTDGLVFDASFDFKDNHFSGLLVANKIENGVQIDLLSKMGTTLMVCKLYPDSVVWDKFIPGLKENKKYKTSAEKSFRIAMLTGLIEPNSVKLRGDDAFICKGRMKVKYQLDHLGEKIIESKEIGWFKIFRRSAYYTYNTNDLIPLEIGIAHSMISFDMFLKRLD